MVTKEKAKQILEVMLMNDANMQVFGFSVLEEIQKGISKNIKPEELLGCLEESKAMSNTYKKIDIPRLTEETGKLIVEKCQPLVAEFYAQYIPLLDKFIKESFKPKEVPEKLFKIRYQVMALSKEYAALEANNLYSKAWQVGYFSHNCKTHADWFLNEKPTEIHPEKLELVLENESTKTICR